MIESSPVVSTTDISGLNGIHAATVCPLTEDGAIEEQELARHVSEIAGSRGMRGLLVNGHAGEGHLMTSEERRRILNIVRGAVPKSCFITAGVTAESTADAVKEAVAAAKTGADAILLFPPNHWALGQDDCIVVDHHCAVASACGLPIVLYKAPLAWNKLSYTTNLLSRLCEIEAVAGIKEGAWEVSAYEELWRRIKAERPGISVMASGDEHLLACYQIGTDGSQVSLAALVPELIIDLFDAVQAGDWSAARSLHECIYPLSREIYRESPPYLATARLKTCLKLTGRIASDRVKRPMRQLSGEEIDRLRHVVP